MSMKYTKREGKIWDRIVEDLKKEFEGLTENQTRNLADSLGNLAQDLFNGAFSLPFEEMGDFCYPYETGDNP